MSKLPSRTFCGNWSRWPIARSVSANEIAEIAYRSATSWTFQDPSCGTLWKITSTARKSMNEIRNAPVTSSANEARYWSCDRICAPTRRRQRKTGSTTLHHQLPRAAREHDATDAEEHERPERLQRDETDELEPGPLAEPHVDGRLDDRAERQRVTELAQPVREE